MVLAMERHVVDYYDIETLFLAGDSECDRRTTGNRGRRGAPWVLSARRAAALAACLAALAACACWQLAARPGGGVREESLAPVVIFDAELGDRRPLGVELRADEAEKPKAAREPATAWHNGKRNKDFTLAGKSIYFMMTDRFARSDGNDTKCAGDDWCGGTLKGIIAHLDYIQGMGFDCIWITPVVKQFEGKDPTNNVTGYHGYWAYDWYKIDEHFGTEQDLKDLSEALHQRDMCLVYDMVVNHVGPATSSADVAKIQPFNETRYFNQLHPTDSFDDYTACWREQKPMNNTVNCATPVQALGEAAFAPNHPTPPDLPFCSIGDYECEGYNDDVTHSGWFYNLGDLNQSVPFVRKHLLRWAVHMVDTYQIDAVRLDTAPFVPTDFLAELQRAVGVEIMGEVTTTNQTFHASFQFKATADGPSADGEQVLDGVLNFPLATVAPMGFCGPRHIRGGSGYPFANFNLTRLGSAMHEQLESGKYNRLDILGNFVDNHDEQPRIGYACKGERSRITNALAWVMFARGVPIIYHGTEQGMNEPHDYRDSLWQFGYNTDTQLYKFFAEMNKVRRDHHLGTASAEVVSYDEHHLVFTRGGKHGAWVYLNNLPSTNESVVYHGAAPPFPPDGMMWADALAIWWKGKPEPAELSLEGGGHHFVARGSMPKVLVLVPTGSGDHGTEAQAFVNKSAEKRTSTKEDSAHADTLCTEQDVAYLPLDMPGRAISIEADQRDCHRRCIEEKDCRQWTYFSVGGACHLSDAEAVAVQHSSGVVAGKRACEVVRFKQL